jgi:hypothetical protein
VVGNVGALTTIVDSTEAQNNVYPIVQIIELATGKLPSVGQLAAWTPFVESAGLLQGNLQTNALLDQMAEAFVASTQFGSTYNGGIAVDPNAPITAAIVSAIIQAATGLAATQSQINNWLSSGLSIDQVFVEFALGSQYSEHLQGVVQNYLIATAINGAALGIIDGTGTLTLGTNDVPLTQANLAVLGGSGLLSVNASGSGDIITELSSGLAGGAITASGNNVTINAANGATTITANGTGDHINLGVIASGTTITAAQIIHASGADDVISFASVAADSSAIGWRGASTVDGGTSSNGIGANSTIYFGNNVGAGSETVVLTGVVAGASTSGGTSTAGIAMTTLDNVVHGGGDQIVFNNAPTEVLAGSAAVNVTSAVSLAKALDMAVAAAAASQSGAQIAAHSGVLVWFQFGGSTYLLEAINSSSTPATHSALSINDAVVKIVGLVDLSGESLAGHDLML